MLQRAFKAIWISQASNMTPFNWLDDSYGTTTNGFIILLQMNVTFVHTYQYPKVFPVT